MADQWDPLQSMYQASLPIQSEGPRRVESSMKLLRKAQPSHSTSTDHDHDHDYDSDARALSIEPTQRPPHAIIRFPCRHFSSIKRRHGLQLLWRGRSHVCPDHSRTVYVHHHPCDAETGAHRIVEADNGVLTGYPSDMLFTGSGEAFNVRSQTSNPGLDTSSS